MAMNDAIRRVNHEIEAAVAVTEEAFTESAKRILQVLEAGKRKINNDGDDAEYNYRISRIQDVQGVLSVLFART